MSRAPSPKHRFAAPNRVKTYRTIGPFDITSLPAGLLREHRTKDGTWARLKILSGEIGFAWDDPESEHGTTHFGPGDVIDIPPTVPHHLEAKKGNFIIEIEFLAEPE